MSVELVMVMCGLAALCCTRCAPPLLPFLYSLVASTHAVAGVSSFASCFTAVCSLFVWSSTFEGNCFCCCCWRLLLLSSHLLLPATLVPPLLLVLLLRLRKLVLLLLVLSEAMLPSLCVPWSSPT